MRLVKKTLPLLLSLILSTQTIADSVAFAKEDSNISNDREVAQYVNKSNEVESQIKISADLDELSKKVKEAKEKKNASEPADIQSLSSTQPDLKQRMDEAPFRVPRTTDSISSLSGSVHLEEIDLTLPGRNGHSFELTRVYDSSDAQLFEMDTLYITYDDRYENYLRRTYERDHYPIGAGWSFNLPYIDFEGGRGELHYQGGSYFVYDYIPEGMRPYGYFWEDVIFVKDTSVQVGTEQSKYLLKSLRDGKRYYFDYRGNLMQISDANGNAIRFYFVHEYYGSNDSGSHLKRIVDDLGNEISITYSPTEVVLRQGSKQVVYKKTVVNPGYGNHELLTEVIDPASRRTVYDYWIKDAYFSLVGTATRESNPYALLTGATHPTGVKSSYVYEDKPTPHYSTYVHMWNNTFVDRYRLLSAENQMTTTDGTLEIKDRLAISYSYTGDPKQIGSYSTTLTTPHLQRTFSYIKDYYELDIYNYYNYYRKTKEVSSHNGTQQTTLYSYANPHKITVPDETSTTWTVNGVNSTPVTTKQSFDTYGNMLTETDPFGRTTTYAYDPSSHLLVAVEQPVDTWQTKRTDYIRDAKGNITQMTVKDQIGRLLRQENYDRDAFGNITATRVTDNGRVITTQTEYGSWYQSAFPTKETLQVTDASGVVATVAQEYEYDPASGRVTKVIDGRGHATSYQYDVLDRVTLKTNPDLSTISIAYKDLENRIEAVDETGLRTYSKWNPLGWKTATGTVSNGIDQPLEKIGYDDYGRKVWSEDALAHRTTYALDGFDRQTAATYTDGGHEASQYDDLNHAVTVTDSDGTVIRETFDKLDRSTKKELITSAGAQLLEEHTYDFLGNERTKKDANGNLTHFTYNVMKELVEVIDPDGKRTQYAYDMRGNLTNVTYADGKTTRKQYDELGRLQIKTDPLGQVETFYHDASNNLVKQIDRKGQSLTFEYSNRNFLTKKTAGSDVVTYEYDKTGRRTKMTDSTGETRYEYTPRGELARVWLQDGLMISYTYDVAGNRIYMKDPFARELYNKHDVRNRLASLSLGSLSNPAEVTNTYAPSGALQSVQLRNGTVSTFTRDEMKRAQTLQQKQANGTVFNSYTYEYDANGNQVRKTENGVSNSFTYDGLDRIKTSTQFNETYAYDDRGNRQTLVSDQVPSLHDAIYEYDAWNRLTKVTTGEGKVVTYRYNGDGLLYERTADGITLRYYYDDDQMIAEGQVAGTSVNLKARYIRSGNRLVAREDYAFNKVYYLHNNHGDVTELRDSNGSTVNSYTYDIWGNSLTATETVDNPFRYSGEYWDQTTSLQYLRARWYDPAQGRFITEDTYEGELIKTLSLNLYAYVLNNPLIYIDPTGHQQDLHSGGASPGGAGGGGILLIIVDKIMGLIKKFTKSGVSINKQTIIDSANQIKNEGGESVVGHALQKHAGRNPDIWGKVKGNSEQINQTALEHLNQILAGSGEFIQVTNNRGVTFLEKKLPDGRGVRLNMDGSFKGFIDQ